MRLRPLAYAVFLPLCGWALVQLFRVSSAKADVGIAVWLVGAVVLHDLVVLPLYTGLDRVARRVVRGPRVSYVRVPAALSLLMLVVFWGLIGRRGDGYALRWLVVTAALFSGSWLLYRAGRGSARPRRRDR
jgi:membrane protein DedA with SNARE-associated domain